MNNLVFFQVENEKIKIRCDIKKVKSYYTLEELYYEIDNLVNSINSLFKYLTINDFITRNMSEELSILGNPANSRYADLNKLLSANQTNDFVENIKTRFYPEQKLIDLVSNDFKEQDQLLLEKDNRDKRKTRNVSYAAIILSVITLLIDNKQTTDAKSVSDLVDFKFMVYEEKIDTGINKTNKTFSHRLDSISDYHSYWRKIDNDFFKWHVEDYEKLSKRVKNLEKKHVKVK